MYVLYDGDTNRKLDSSKNNKINKKQEVINN